MKKNKNKNKNKKIKVAITLLYCLALIFAAIPFAKYFAIATHAQLTTVQETKTLPTIIPDAQPLQAPQVQDVLAAAGNQDRQAVGQVVIPKVDISQPIFVGLTLVNMGNGTVSLFPNRTPDKNSLTIIGHHLGFTTLLFGRIKELVQGDMVYVRYLGQYYQYEVQTSEVINENQVDKLVDKGPDWLFLLTCEVSFESPERVFVRAKRVDTKPQEVGQAMEVFTQKASNTKIKNYLFLFILPIILVIIFSILFLRYVWKKL
ncbi:MAG: class A sortase [Streptococcaceae bacterium]|jgi:sortase A|nr:class A sortase [Streptococcaceae bacterium]